MNTVANAPLVLTPDRLARLLYLARERRRATQADMAALVGVSADTYGTWERAERFPRGMHVRQRIQRLLGVAVVWPHRNVRASSAPTKSAQAPGTRIRAAHGMTPGGPSTPRPY